MLRPFKILMFTLGLAMAAVSQAQVIAGPVNNPTNGHNYYIIGIANFGDYTLAAQNLGGYPVVINNAAENTWIHQNLMAEVPFWWDHAYIGLTDDVIEGDWRWMEGVNDTYTNWNAGEPNDSGNEDYASMRRESGNWNDLPAPNPGDACAIVEVNPIGSEPTGIQYGPICDHTTGSVYYMLTPATHEGAEQFAANNLDSHLVTIDSLEENTFITLHLLRLRGVGDFVNIGLTDRTDEGVFQWDDGSSSEFRMWWHNEPNNHLDEDYVYMIAAPGITEGFWYDGSNAPRPAIVEVKTCAADVDRDGLVAVPDIFAFLATWFSGCP